MIQEPSRATVGIPLVHEGEEVEAPSWHLAGEVARQRLGIDGTAGDAQDIAHPYTPEGFAHCVVCGLAASARVHSTLAESADYLN